MADIESRVTSLEARQQNIEIAFAENKSTLSYIAKEITAIGRREFVSMERLEHTVDKQLAEARKLCTSAFISNSEVEHIVDKKLNEYHENRSRKVKEGWKFFHVVIAIIGSIFGAIIATLSELFKHFK